MLSQALLDLLAASLGPQEASGPCSLPCLAVHTTTQLQRRQQRRRRQLLQPVCHVGPSLRSASLHWAALSQAPHWGLQEHRAQQLVSQVLQAVLQRLKTLPQPRLLQLRQPRQQVCGVHHTHPCSLVWASARHPTWLLQWRVSTLQEATCLLRATWASHHRSSSSSQGSQGALAAPAQQVAVQPQASSRSSSTSSRRAALRHQVRQQAAVLALLRVHPCTRCHPCWLPSHRLVRARLALPWVACLALHSPSSLPGASLTGQRDCQAALRLSLGVRAPLVLAPLVLLHLLGKERARLGQQACWQVLRVSSQGQQVHRGKPLGLPGGTATSPQGHSLASPAVQSQLALQGRALHKAAGMLAASLRCSSSSSSTRLSSSSTASRTALVLGLAGPLVAIQAPLQQALVAGVALQWEHWAPQSSWLQARALMACQVSSRVGSSSSSMAGSRHSSSTGRRLGAGDSLVVLACRAQAPQALCMTGTQAHTCLMTSWAWGMALRHLHPHL